MENNEDGKFQPSGASTRRQSYKNYATNKSTTKNEHQQRQRQQQRGYKLNVCQRQNYTNTHTYMYIHSHTYIQWKKALSAAALSARHTRSNIHTHTSVHICMHVYSLYLLYLRGGLI